VLKKLLDNPKLKAKLSIMLQNAPGLPSLPDGTRTIGSRIALVNSRFGNYLDGIAEADKQSAQNP
jgi:hypothetical protein